MSIDTAAHRAVHERAPMTPEQQALRDAMRAGAAALCDAAIETRQIAAGYHTAHIDHMRKMARAKAMLADAALLTAAADRIERGEPSREDELRAAYEAGATAVHDYWASGCTAQEADFGEAASDYAADAIARAQVQP